MLSFTKKQDPVEIEFEVYCAICGAGLFGSSSTSERRRYRYPRVLVKPCQLCIDAAVEKIVRECYFKKGDEQ